MYLTQNPVLQHELLSNLRRPQAFLLLLAYVAMLGGVVLLAWPQQSQLDMSQPVAAQRLVGLFFFGQYLLASMMAPSFAAGAITGEKERLSFEMLLASPLRPGAIVLGKLLAAIDAPGHLDALFAADRDALPAAGGRGGLRRAGGLRGDAFDREPVRHD